MEIQLSTTFSVIKMQHCWKFLGTRQSKADFSQSGGWICPSAGFGENIKDHFYPPARTETLKSLDIIEKEEAENVFQI